MSDMDDEDESATGHGIDGACYAGGPGIPYYQPVMMCTCGWTTGRCDNWEEAGACFDEHLEDSR